MTALLTSCANNTICVLCYPYRYQAVTEDLELSGETEKTEYDQR